MHIRSAMEKYAAGNRLRFHTPGHKGDLHPLDLTEIEGAFPEDCVVRAQRDAAKAYGAEHIRFLVNGSSSGVKAAILASEGALLAENISHPAVFEGAELARVGVHTLDREMRDGLYIPPTAERVLSALAAHPDVKTVLLTSPDYYGRVVGEEVFAAVTSRGYSLLVDGAHGAHFAFSPLLPELPLRYARCCNMSAHKTMESYTQTAYLAVRGDPSPVDRALKLLGTTSPSYLFLSALERAVAVAARADYAGLKAATDVLRARFRFAPNDDFTRLVLDCEPFSMSGRQAYARLLALGVGAETFNDRYVVFIASPNRIGDVYALNDVLEKLHER